MGPSGEATVFARRYRPGTASLETTWLAGGGRLTLNEGMIAEVIGGLLPSTLLVRRLAAEGGPVEAVINFDPRRGEQRRRPRSQHRGDILVCSWGASAIAVSCSPPVRLEPGQPTTVTITPGHPLTVVLALAEREPMVYVGADTAWAALEADEQRWRRWCDDIDGGLPYRDIAVRSLLTLRLLTYSPSGAPVAAPTTSLPESLGGIRNWDYRFAWPRDASLAIGAFLGAGQPDEARRFLAWLLSASRLTRPRLPALFTLFGRRPRSERDVEGWIGYANSKPVRMGNSAAEQHQLDGYGWVLDAAGLLVDAGHHLNTETWRAMRGFANEVADCWSEPDAGIWEIRGDGAHHVHSKLMGWLALDRAIRIASTHRTPSRQLTRWRIQRDAIGAEVTTRGFNPSLGSYTRTYGSTDLDAAVLVLPLLGLEPPNSLRVRGTIDAIARHLSAGGPLIYRYPPGQDNLPGTEGAFLPCSFWLVQALAVTGRTSEAHDLFEALCALASPLGLYGEEMDPVTNRHLGNYPQALTHAALLQAALSLRAQ
jgi:GH15 family glucan-1,4-alpha-glucosidase